MGVELDTEKGGILVNKRSCISGNTIFARAFHAVTEEQTRETLHLQFLLWLNYQPSWFVRFIHDADFQEKFGSFIDSNIVASISDAEHALRETPLEHKYPTVISNISE